MLSRVLNFLWLNLNASALPDPADGTIRLPMPEKYIKNVCTAGKSDSETEIMLWVDSQRLTEKQMNYLRQAIEKGLPNVHLRDLREIPEYAHEELFNKSANSLDRENDASQLALIWRQVDVAKVLICLQDDFDQTFFADLDYSHLATGSPEVQDILKKYDIVIGGSIRPNGVPELENQLWGFDRSRLNFFQRLYTKTLEGVHTGTNGFLTMVLQTWHDLHDCEGIDPTKVCLLLKNDGTEASHPEATIPAAKKHPKTLPTQKLSL